MSDVRRELREIARGLANRGQADTWPVLQQLGLPWVSVPEDRGGSGGDLGDLAALVSELAEAGLLSPIVEAAVAAWVGGVPSGNAHGTVVVGESAPVVHDERVSGVLHGVRGVRGADHVVVCATDRTFRVELDAAGVRCDEARGVSGTRTRVVLDEAHVVELPGAPGRADVLARLDLLRSAQMVGAAKGALSLTLDYVRTRQQFGKPLVALPSVVAAVGRMTAEVRSAEVALERGLVPDAESATMSWAAAAVARVMCAQMAGATARTAHQLHGAMGVAAEYPLHTFTTVLWDARDADHSEDQAAESLGRQARTSGADALWDELTAWRIPGEAGSTAPR